jgi:hypothetical protein
MGFQPYSEPDAARFAEIANLFTECRSAFRDVTQQTQWQPTSGSAALRDIEALSHHEPSYPAQATTKVPQIVYFYLLAASEQLGGLAALYSSHEVVLAPGALVRSTLEFCAHALWVLQPPAVEDRLARAYLEELLSADEARKASAQLLGKEDPRYLKRAATYSALKDEVALSFPGEFKYERGRPVLRGNHVPGLAACVKLMYGSVSRPVNEDAARGIYTFYSNLTHPTLYQLGELWGVSQRDGQITLVPRLGAENHEKQIRLTTVAFYEVLSYVMSYHGLPRARHDQLSDKIEQLLPGLLKGTKQI